VFGNEALAHGTICILINYAVMKLFDGSLATTVFLFVFQLVYMVIGYVIVRSETYDISWTMPHCVMTLRLIGVAMDVFDGKKVSLDPFASEESFDLDAFLFAMRPMTKFGSPQNNQTHIMPVVTAASSFTVLSLISIVSHKYCRL